MALPSFLGYFTLGNNCVQRANLPDSRLHYTIAPGSRIIIMYSALFGRYLLCPLWLRTQQAMEGFTMPTIKEYLIGRNTEFEVLAYNMIRKIMVTSASLYEKQPRRLSFTLTCQTILSAWMLLAADICRDTQEMHAEILAKISLCTMRYPLMKRSRQQLRAELGKT